VAGFADMMGIARSLAAVLARIDDDTIVITGHTEISNGRDLFVYVQLLNETLRLVRDEIAAGQSEKQVTDAGLPALWKRWYAPAAVPAEHEFMQAIYQALTHTNDVNQ
jgi:hypothetical protein